MNPAAKEDLVRRLAVAIDPDEPPGLAANELAREVLTLVQGLGGVEATRLLRPIRELREQRRRRELGDFVSERQRADHEDNTSDGGDIYDPDVEGM